MPGALGALPRVRDPVLGLLVDERLGQVDRPRCRSAPAARGRARRPRPRAPSSRAAARAGRRAAPSSVSNSEAVLANSSSASGSFLALTSFTSTWNETSLPARSPKRSGSASLNFKISPARLAVELLVQLRAELAGADLVEVVGAAWPRGPPRRARCCACRRRRSRSARTGARPARARRTARGGDRGTRRPPRRSTSVAGPRPSVPCSRSRSSSSRGRTSTVAVNIERLALLDLLERRCRGR